uniref:F-box domain-containing protein n=1 Tax=Strongyloides papillosus TaxID=174720 RepID=A0A0N5CCV7_STREA
MDLNHLNMDFTIEDEYFEVKDDTSVLPDNVLAIILSKLSWKDILSAKLVSRRFYSIIHGNCQKLRRRRMESLMVEYNENHETSPFNIKMHLESGIKTYSLFYSSYYKEITNIQSDEELSSTLKLFDMRNLAKLHVPVADNLDIFGILNRSFQTGTKIDELIIFKLAEKDFSSFRTFVEKLSSVRSLSIEHICAPSTEAKDIFSLLSLSSFNTLNNFTIYECSKSKVLSGDIVAKLIRGNPNLFILEVGPMDVKNSRSILKSFVITEQPHRMKYEYERADTLLVLYYGGDFKQLGDIFRNDFNELEDIEKINESYFSENSADLEFNVDCRYCLNNNHKFTRRFCSLDTPMTDRNLDH